MHPPARDQCPVSLHPAPLRPRSAEEIAKLAMQAPEGRRLQDCKCTWDDSTCDGFKTMKACMDPCDMKWVDRQKVPDLTKRYKRCQDFSERDAKFAAVNLTCALDDISWTCNLLGPSVCEEATAARQTIAFSAIGWFLFVICLAKLMTFCGKELERCLLSAACDKVLALFYLILLLCIATGNGLFTVLLGEMMYCQIANKEPRTCIPIVGARLFPDDLWEKCVEANAGPHIEPIIALISMAGETIYLFYFILQRCYLFNCSSARAPQDDQVRLASTDSAQLQMQQLASQPATPRAASLHPATPLPVAPQSAAPQTSGVQLLSGPVCRLQQLEELKRAGLIDEIEFERKRKDIIEAV